ncbi:MAG: hypothetical protein ABSB63_15070 [Spirochaetia bacterium]|jgi:predicted Fe-Mo cluster-binding NifX family protein
MLAGNMGEEAVHVLQAHGINVVRGVSGNAREVTGALADSGEPCAAHGIGHAHGSNYSHAI